MSVGLLKNGDGVLISDDLEICEILNRYFGSVFTKENLSDKLPAVQQVFKGDLSLNLTDIIITPEVVVEKLKKLKSNKAPGTDLTPSVYHSVLSLENRWMKMLFQKIGSWQTFLLFFKMEPRIMWIITGQSV